MNLRSVQVYKTSRACQWVEISEENEYRVLLKWCRVCCFTCRSCSESEEHRAARGSAVPPPILCCDPYALDWGILLMCPNRRWNTIGTKPERHEENHKEREGLYLLGAYPPSLCQGHIAPGKETDLDHVVTVRSDGTTYARMEGMMHMMSVVVIFLSFSYAHQVHDGQGERMEIVAYPGCLHLQKW